MLLFLALALIHQVAAKNAVDLPGCDSEAIYVTSSGSSVTWKSADGTYIPSQSCTLTLTWPSNTYVNLTVESQLRADSHDSLLVSDRIDQLLTIASSAKSVEVYRIPNGNDNCQNAVTIDFSTDDTPYAEGLVIIMFNSVQMPSTVGRMVEYPLDDGHMSASAPLVDTYEDETLPLFLSGSPSPIDPVYIELLSEVELSDAGKSSLRNVFIFEGDASKYRPLYRLATALVSGLCKSNTGRLFVIYLDNTPNTWLNYFHLVVTRQKYLNGGKPIQYRPFFVDGGPGLKKFEYSQNTTSAVPILLKRYDDRKNGLFVDSIKYTPFFKNDELALVIGGVENSNSVLELVRTNGTDAHNWNNFYVNTKYGISVLMPNGGAVTITLAIDKYYPVAYHPEGSRGVILSGRDYPYLTTTDTPFQFTLAKFNALSTVSFSGSWLGVVNGSLQISFATGQPNSNDTKTYTSDISPVGLTVDATEVDMSYSPSTTSHSGFLLRYHIADKNDNPTTTQIPTTTSLPKTTTVRGETTTTTVSPPTTTTVGGSTTTSPSNHVTPTQPGSTTTTRSPTTSTTHTITTSPSSYLTVMPSLLFAIIALVQ